MSLKTKIGLALATTAVGATLAGAGTFALFTSSATNTGNTFTAGKVVINDTTGHAAYSSTLHYGNLAPGDAEDATITVTNNGNLDEWVAIKDITKAADPAAPAGTPNIFAGAYPLALTFTEGENAPVKIAAGNSTTLHVHYNFPSGAGNEYQGAQGIATVNIEAVQARNNETGATPTGPNSWQ
ncbi:TasA family protein [Aneurinibacillus sp. Ricciae_BoGa-3]|uniref:TasA family protein n=1 Tax=Aneurinibacillus sp. Ricciae_BoGa-3 TaxID=3022697 RepID=UPI002341E90F|nr:TasA family protein [Aneurinibacillus sp. Ricciae_BoGa-3]WCK52413.1 TasA family protein [Aneurinibacillus sp. Ricciae_BoGa-3]